MVTPKVSSLSHHLKEAVRSSFFIIVVLFFSIGCSENKQDDCLLSIVDISISVCKKNNSKNILQIVENVDSVRSLRIIACSKELDEIRSVIADKISNDAAKENIETVYFIRGLILEFEKRYFGEKTEMYRDFIIKDYKDIDNIKSISNLKLTMSLELEVLINYYICQLAEEF